LQKLAEFLLFTNSGTSWWVIWNKSYWYLLFYGCFRFHCSIQGCGVGALGRGRSRSPNNLGWLEPESTFFRWWSWSL